MAEDKGSQAAASEHYRSNRGKWLAEHPLGDGYMMISRVGYVEIAYDDPETGEREILGFSEMDELSVATGSTSAQVIFRHVTEAMEMVQERHERKGL